MSGCASTGNVPASGTAFKLDGCSPFLNCVSSESSVGLYQVQSIELLQPLDPSSWDRIKSTALELPGASLEEARYGYANITCYSDFFGFPDFLEILVADDGRHLNVRSQSMLGFYDLGVNRARVERLREHLAEKDIAVGAVQ
ncbi:hypothetical protein MSNKSG1_05661 [Marinobacter santoriniensis NKSG1]|uniref:Uncharacterized protein n=2 Tax=Marinobacter santoriniensis TaxID=523742 RepID=M7CT63_9GAMM|nr:hypothetical protein MSNKSG1_05661 [Marinobacter santoriniensis NKSG1]